MIGVKNGIFYRNFVVSILLLVLLFFSKLVFNTKYVFIAFIISLVGYLAILSFYRALKIDKVGVVLPIANSSLLFAVLFSVLFYGENLSPIQILIYRYDYWWDYSHFY